MAILFSPLIVREVNDMGSIFQFLAVANSITESVASIYEPVRILIAYCSTAKSPLLRYYFMRHFTQSIFSPFIVRIKNPSFPLSI